MVELPFQIGQFEQLDFEIIDEAWNSYLLDDGGRLKTRAILNKVYGTKVDRGSIDNKMQLVANFQNIVVAYPTDEMRGAPNPSPPHASEASKMKLRVINIIEPRVEKWNNYRLINKKIIFKLKMIVTSIQRVEEVYTDDGAPYYLVNSQLMTDQQPE